MNFFSQASHLRCSQSGASAVIVAVMLTTLIGFMALVVDLGYIYSERNRLQNAVDAGALAGARALYSHDGKSINTGADAVAAETAKMNWAGENYAVKRGHWSFGIGTLAKNFYENQSTSIFDLWNYSAKDLDEEKEFINAIEVSAILASPISSFFSKIWGNQGFKLTAKAVGYIGFAGTVEPMTFDEPIAICKQAITYDDKYSCQFGRVLTNNSNAAAWTSFEQPCSGAASASALKKILMPCPTAGANINPVAVGSSTTTTNIVDISVFKALYNCWENGNNSGVSIDTDHNGIPDQPWKMTLTVIDCLSKDTNCKKAVGAVEINVVWVLEKETDESPYKMGDWRNTSPDDATRWSSFVGHFKLKNPVDPKNPSAPLIPATKQNETIYFVPDCAPHEPAGLTGGENFGILSKIPVLVQ